MQSFVITFENRNFKYKLVLSQINQNLEKHNSDSQNDMKSKIFNE